MKKLSVSKGSWALFVFCCAAAIATVMLVTTIVVSASGAAHATTESTTTGASVSPAQTASPGVPVHVPPATLTTLYAFTGNLDGIFPGSLARDSAGNLYGTVSSGAYNYGAIFKIDNMGKESVLFSFDSDDGSGPNAPLALDAQGNLYGTTSSGGDYICFETGCGNVFKLDASGQLTVLYTFLGSEDSFDGDGDIPFSSVALDKSSNVYGAAMTGGDLSCDGGFGCGVIYKIVGTQYTVLYRFTGGTSDGGFPEQNVTLDTAGNIYGTTAYYGASNLGTVFKVTPTGSETVLHSFTNTPDGATPSGALLRDSQGNLYGTTESGGTYGQGTVFKLDTSGNETVLYNFQGGSDGGAPEGGLIKIGSQLIGTAGIGGDLNCSSFLPGCGVVFQVGLDGKEQVVYTFHGIDGIDPNGPLVADENGNLYGTTGGGGHIARFGCNLYGCGTVFKITRH